MTGTKSALGAMRLGGQHKEIKHIGDRDDFAVDPRMVSVLRGAPHASPSHKAKSDFPRNLDLLFIDEPLDEFRAFNADKMLESIIEDEPKNANDTAATATSPLQSLKRKLSDWKLKKKPEERPESFMCSTAAAVEELARTNRDRYEVARPHNRIQAPNQEAHAYQALTVCPYAAPLKNLHDVRRQQQKLRQKSELPYLQPPVRRSSFPANMHEIFPVPPVPEKYRKAPTV